MTSQVNPNNIDGTYPVAGQDNDSQGFRDNFTNIRNNFTYVKAEIEDIQNKAIYKSALSNTTLENDLLGNAIVGASLTGYRETYNNIGAVGGAFTVDFANGNFQKITIASPGAAILSFTFPSNAANQNAKVVLWVNVTTPGYSLTLPSAVSLGDKDTIAGINGNTITFSAIELANTNDYFFEFSTVDYGTTIAVKDLTRNRAYNFSGLTVSGGNLVANSTTVSTSATTGALVVNGGAGVAGNVFVNGNLIINGGIVNPDYFIANVVTGQNLRANIDFNRFICNASPTGTVANLFITLPNAIDGRQIDFTSMTPITSCFISNMTPGVTSVYGLANNWATSASLTNSVSIRLLYSASVGRWFKVG
jgi:hypothetical protein